MQGMLEMLQLGLVGIAIVASLALIRPGDLFVQGQVCIGMRISLDLDVVGNHQAFSYRNDILNKAITQTLSLDTDTEQRSGKEVQWIHT